MIALITGPSELLIISIILILTIFPLWRIFAKAGYSGALSLLMLIPLVNIAMVYFLAFAKWPALAQANQQGQ